MCLCEASSGSNVKVIGFKGGKHFRGKLLSLGIMPGVPLKVIENNGRHAPMLISVMDNRVIIGKMMAHRIEVK